MHFDAALFLQYDCDFMAGILRHTKLKNANSPLQVYSSKGILTELNISWVV